MIRVTVDLTDGVFSKELGTIFIVNNRKAKSKEFGNYDVFWCGAALSEQGGCKWNCIRRWRRSRPVWELVRRAIAVVVRMREVKHVR